MLLSTVSALVAALLFAVTTNLQRVSAASVPGSHGPVRLVGRLVRDVRWLLSGIIGVAALALHALALARGSVTVVQAVMAVGLVLTLHLEALREGRRLRSRETSGAALIVVGVAGVVLAGSPGRHDRPADAWLLVAPVVLAAAALTVVTSRHGVGNRWHARLLAGMGGVCFAVDAVFLQRVAGLFDVGDLLGTVAKVGTPVGAAALAGFVSASLLGTVSVHRAYQVAPLRTVQPALASAEPVTAFLLGVLLLGENVRWGGLGYVVGAAGLVALTAGIVVGSSREASVAAPVGRDPMPVPADDRQERGDAVSGRPALVVASR